MAPVRALRLSFVGELGYELHLPMEYQRHLYDILMDEGEQYGIVDWGYGALDSMRLEKGHRLWGEDMFADGEPVAYVASDGYGHRIEKSIAFSYLPKELAPLSFRDQPVSNGQIQLLTNLYIPRVVAQSVETVPLQEHRAAVVDRLP